MSDDGDRRGPKAGKRSRRVLLMEEFETQFRWYPLVHAAYALSIIVTVSTVAALILAVVFHDPSSGSFSVGFTADSWFWILLIIGLPPLHFLRKRVKRRYEEAKRRLEE